MNTTDPVWSAGEDVRISVICPWYNRADRLRQTVDSLLAQTASDFEIILVNDGSRDPRVLEILESYDDPRLRVVTQENGGFVRAILHAVSLARGCYLAVQGAGDISLPERLARQADYLASHPYVVMVGCHYNNTEILPDGQVLRHPMYPKETPGLEDLLRANPFSHGEVMMRREAYDAAGGYRPEFARAQDIDLWLRLQDHGLMRILPETLYERHIFRKDGIAASLERQLVQIAFAVLARQCHRQRQYSGEDAVDRFGGFALFGLSRNPDLAQRVIKAVRRAVRDGSYDSAVLKDIRLLFGPVIALLARCSVPLFRLELRLKGSA